MRFERPSSEPEVEPESPEDIDRTVAINGKFLGRELGEYSLFAHSTKGQAAGSNMMGGDAFTEFYFDTESGNTYRISQAADSRWIIGDVNSNKGKSPDQMRGTVLTESDLENGKLRIGDAFVYGKDGKTTKITKITAVNGGRVYDANYIKEQAEGRTSDVRNDFAKRLATKV